MEADHCTDASLRRFAERQCDESELLLVDAHIRTCAECRARLPQSPARVASLRSALGDVEHLSFDSQIVPYVEGRLGAEATSEVEEHVAGCEVCRREVSELREFVEADAAATRARLAQRVPPRRWRAVAATLAAAAAVVLVVLVPKWWVKTPPATQTTQIVQTTQPPPQPQPPAPLVVALHDGGGIVGVDGNGGYRGPVVSPALAQRIASVLANPDLAKPVALLAVAGQPRALRGGETPESPLRVIAPAGVAILETKPRFVWTGPSLGGSKITIVDEQMREVRGEAVGNEWTPRQPLAAGHVYTWQVSTSLAGKRVIAPAPPEPPATFRIVSATTVAAIDEARKTGNHLAAGLLAFDAGAIDEARKEFEQLAAANPDSEIPRRLIASCERQHR